MIWVIDAGPLIFLSKLDRLHLLKDAADEVIIPTAVFQEIQAQSDEAANRITSAADSWLQVKTVNNEQAVELLLTSLDRGEAEVIVLAKELNAGRIILDDLDARRFARQLGFSIIGTLGLLLAARLRNEIPSLKDEIERLQKAGFWASDVLVAAVLQEAGE